MLTILGELCCVALSFCCVVLVAQHLLECVHAQYSNDKTKQFARLSLTSKPAHCIHKGITKLHCVQS